MALFIVERVGTGFTVRNGDNALQAAASALTAEAWAEQAAASALTAEAWAEGTLPGGAGTKSAKEWSDTASATVAAIPFVGSSRTPIFEVAFETENGNVGGFDQSGTFRTRAVTADTLNSQPSGVFVSRRESIADVLRGAIHFLPWCGQSLQGGSAYGANHTLSQEYGAVAFQRQSSSPTAYQPATATSEYITGTSVYGSGYPAGEMPMFGTCYLGELIEWRHGIRIDQVGIKPLLCCDATGGTTIGQNAKGGSTGNYARVLTQVTSAKTIALAEGWPLVAKAVMWNQGESDDGNNYTAYKTSLKQLQVDYDTDIRAITGGLVSDPVKLIFNQTNSVTSTNGAIARAQFDALAENTNLIMSTPKYMADYADQWHVMARDSKWIGAYDILAYYFTFFEGVQWKPLSFVLDSVIGNYVFLKAVGNHGPLVIDEVALPPQSGGGMIRGFTATTGAGAAVIVQSVDLAGDSRIRVKLASYAAGYNIQYALAPAVTRNSPYFGGTPYVGGAGNIRDSLGDFLPMFRGNGVRKKMHKWAVAQEITV